MRTLKLLFFSLIALAMLIPYTPANAQTENNENQQVYILGGSSTVTNYIFNPHKSDIENHSGQKIKIVTSSSGRGLLALHEKQADIAMISTDLTRLIETINQTGNNLNTTDFNAHFLDTINIMFVTHHQNPVKTLTKDQIKRLFLGQIKNWAELGYPELGPVKIVTEHPTGGMYNSLVQSVLNGEDITSERITMQNAPQVAIVVAQLPNSIGFLSNATPESQRLGVKSISAPDVSIEQKLFLVTSKDENRPEISDIITSTKAVLLNKKEEK